MSSKPRRSRKQKRSQHVDEQFVSNEDNNDDVSANLDQLIVRSNEPSYNNKFMEIGNQDINNKETFVSSPMKSAPVQPSGSLLRNCAMAITGQTSIEPIKSIPNPKEHFEKKPEPEPLQEPIEESPQQYQQPMPPQTVNNVEIAQTENIKVCDQVQVPTQLRYDGYTDHSIPTDDKIVVINPNVTHRRHFNKKLFRISYIIVIILLVICFGIMFFIHKVKKHQKKLEMEKLINKIDTVKPNEIPETEEPTMEPVMEGGDFSNPSDYGFDETTFVDQMETEEPHTTPQPNQARMRDSRGRFVKAVDSVL